MIDKKEREEVVKRIDDLSKNILFDIKNKKNPKVVIPLRSLSNVKYNEEKEYLELGEKEVDRYFLNTSHVRSFMQTLMVADKCRELAKKGKTASIREMYYELKRTVPNTNENTFEAQTESDPVIIDLETSLEVLREHLGLKADSKGTLFGEIVIEDSGDKIDCSKLGKSGLAIPSIVDDYKFLKNKAKYILAVETKAMVDRLVEEKFHLKNNCVLVGMGGQPSRGTRRLIHLMHTKLKLPVYVFCDGDPYGLYIYSVVKTGSMNLAYESKNLSTPNAKFLGMSVFDVERYGLQKVTEKMKKGDFIRVGQMKEYPWLQSERWQKELDMMLKKGIRIEQQALASKSLEFVAETYLPEKIKKKDFF